MESLCYSKIENGIFQKIYFTRLSEDFTPKIGEQMRWQWGGAVVV